MFLEFGEVCKLYMNALVSWIFYKDTLQARRIFSNEKSFCYLLKLFSVVSKLYLLVSLFHQLYANILFIVYTVGLFIFHVIKAVNV